MIEAWLVVPALAWCTWSLAPGPCGRVVRWPAMVVVVVAVSFSWMLFVTLSPASQRPVRRREPAQLRLRAGVRLQRLRSGRPAVAERAGGADARHPVPGRPGAHPDVEPPVHRPLRRDGGWLLPDPSLCRARPALRSAGSPGPTRYGPGIMLWGTWLVVLRRRLHRQQHHQLVLPGRALAPRGGLLGIGAKLAWEGVTIVSLTRAALGAMVLTTGYAFWLLPGPAPGFRPGCGPTVLVLGIARHRPGTGHDRIARPGQSLAARVAVLIVGLGSRSPGPRSWHRSRSWPTRSGPSTPPSSRTAADRTSPESFFGAPLQDHLDPPGKLEARCAGAPDLMATQTSVLAAQFIYRHRPRGAAHRGLHRQQP
jgi:hypothetical protein